jgi:hypothetical protein
MDAIELIEQFEGLRLTSCEFRIRNQVMQGWIRGSETGRLEGRGKKSVGVVGRAAQGASVEENDVAWQVLRLAT